MQEKKTQQPTQNIQMMRSKPCEDGPSINIVIWSNIDTKEDKAVGKQPEEDPWVRMDAHKDIEFDLHKEKETFMEAKKIFVDSRASTSKNHNAWKKKPEEIIAMLLA